MKTFEIYFSDLNEDAQKRLLKAVNVGGRTVVEVSSPKDMNRDIDILPIAMYDFEEESK